ncbi:SGK494 [Acanthosepion pharaonis]|uniref:SGK494 n=1 Tax=Acanthosepion pharaonis TaxID=158019 RepID=A0A812DGI5_ACAPH|nr:SGK494 [Sepia pharaonis]
MPPSFTFSNSPMMYPPSLHFLKLTNDLPPPPFTFSHSPMMYPPFTFSHSPMIYPPLHFLALTNDPPSFTNDLPPPFTHTNDLPPPFTFSHSPMMYPPSFTFSHSPMMYPPPFTFSHSPMIYPPPFTFSHLIEDEEQFYAVKVLDKNQIILENAVQQCKDEATIQSMLGHHPFIVKVLEFWQSRSHLYIVLTFVPYGDMFTLWSYHGHFPETLVKYQIAELAVVISYLHKSGVIYRDMKMENILFDFDGHTQITDFGLAKWLTYGEKTRTVCGTLQYMAPEVLSVVAYGHTADWWSLGVLMYTMLTGEYPVDGAANHFEMASLVSECEYLLPTYISEKCQAVVSRLLTKCPNRRLTDLFSLQNLPFFKGIDFNALIEKQISLRNVVPPDFFDVPVESEDSYLCNGSLNEFSEFDDFVWHLPPDVVPVYV